MEWSHLVKNKVLAIWVCLLLGLCVLFIYQQKKEHRVEIADCKEQMLEDSLTTKQEWKTYLLNKEADVEAGKSEFKEYSSEIFVTALEEELDDVKKIENYPDYIKKIKTSSQSLQSISIFAEQDAFSKKNLNKTWEDYTSQVQIHLERVNTDLYRNFFSFDLMHIVLFIACIFLAGNLVDENGEGLRRMLFSTKKGRGRRCVSKVEVLFVGCSILCMLFYGFIFEICSVMYHGNIIEDIGKPIQSVTEFYTFPYSLSIGCFMLFYLIIRILIMFCLSLMIWGMLVFTENRILTVSVFGILGVCEYLLWIYVSSNSNWNILHYCNVFEWMLGNGFFSEYRNLNIMGHAIHKNSISIIISMLLILISWIVTYMVAQRRYPSTTHLWMQEKWNRLRKCKENWNAKILEKCSLFSMESYKLLIIQRGIFVFLILGCFLYCQTDLTEVNKTEKQKMYEQFISEHQGMIDADSKNEIAKREKQLKKADEEYVSMGEQYEKGKITIEQWISEQVKMEKYESRRGFLQQIKQQTKKLEDMEQGRGIKGWYVNQYSYSYLLGENKNTILYNIVFFIAIILLSSSIFSEAKQEGMEDLIKVSIKGRSTIFRKKISLVIAVVLSLFCVSTILELVIMKKVYGLEGIMAPVQSIISLEFIPIHCSIFEFLVFMYVVKLCIMLSTAMVACYVSSRYTQKVLLVVVTCMVLPSVLYAIGMKECKYISIIHVWDVFQFIQTSRNFMFVIAELVCSIGLGMGGFFMARQNWK